VTSEFKLTTTQGGDEWYERKVPFGTYRIALRIGDQKDLLTKSLPFANAVGDNPQQILKRFQTFKNDEAKKNPESADDIHRLEIESISFFNPNRPEVGEVLFSADSGGEAWSCLIDGGEFKDLISNSS